MKSFILKKKIKQKRTQIALNRSETTLVLCMQQLLPIKPHFLTVCLKMNFQNNLMNSDANLLLNSTWY